MSIAGMELSFQGPRGSVFRGVLAAGAVPKGTRKLSLAPHLVKKNLNRRSAFFSFRAPRVTSQDPKGFVHPQRSSSATQVMHRLWMTRAGTLGARLESQMVRKPPPEPLAHQRRFQAVLHTNAETKLSGMQIRSLISPQHLHGLPISLVL